jgi:thymidine phosphorylase
MIYLGKKANSLKEGEQIAKEKIENGEAFKKFTEIVEHQGGDINYITNPGKYPRSRCVKKVLSDKSGYIKVINTYQIGMASLELGAGRKTKTDIIDPKAGMVFYKKIGDRVRKGELICELHSEVESKIKLAEEIIFESIKFSTQKPPMPKLIKKTIK